MAGIDQSDFRDGDTPSWEARTAGGRTSATQVLDGTISGSGYAGNGTATQNGTQTQPAKAPSLSGSIVDLLLGGHTGYGRVLITAGLLLPSYIIGGVFLNAFFGTQHGGLKSLIFGFALPAMLITVLTYGNYMCLTMITAKPALNDEGQPIGEPASKAGWYVGFVVFAAFSVVIDFGGVAITQYSTEFPKLVHTWVNGRILPDGDHLTPAYFLVASLVALVDLVGEPLAHKFRRQWEREDQKKLNSRRNGTPDMSESKPWQQELALIACGAIALYIVQFLLHTSGFNSPIHMPWS